jgi:tRNA-binding protein
MAAITWGDFSKVEICVGTIVGAEVFAEARKPAFKLTIDFGEALGERKSSAQLTDLYTEKQLIGRQVVAVINFPKKQIGPFMSECLITGFVQRDGSVVLAIPERPVENGLRLA